MLRFVNPIRTVKVCSITRDFCDLVNNRKKKNKQKKKNNDITRRVLCLSHVPFFFVPGSCTGDHVKRKVKKY